jgi:hypothetical protein
MEALAVSGARVEDAAVSGGGVGGDVAGYSAEVFGPDRRSRQISNKSDLDLQGPLLKQSLAPVTASASILSVVLMAGRLVQGFGGFSSASRLIQ